jgi:hypothetical protein
METLLVLRCDPKSGALGAEMSMTDGPFLLEAKRLAEGPQNRTGTQAGANRDHTQQRNANN